MSQAAATLAGLVWNDLRGQAETSGVRVVVCALPEEVQPALYWPTPRRPYVLLHHEIEEPDRSALLAHELAHHRRGGGVGAPGMSVLWDPLVAREETACNREVARRLVPLDRLSRFCDELAEFGEGVAPDDVCEEFHVPRWVAVVALEERVTYERCRRHRREDG